MEYLAVAKKICVRTFDFAIGTWNFFKTGKTLQPKKIALTLEDAVEKNKKVMIDGTYAPNRFTVYLSPMDMVEMRPLIKTLQNQLSAYIAESIAKKGYKIIAGEVTIELKESIDQPRSQIYVDAFITEGGKEAENTTVKEEARATGDKLTRFLEEENATKLIEDTKTRILDETKVQLEMVAGEEAGRIIELSPGEYTFGRSSDADIVVKDGKESVSRLHFLIKVAEGKVSLKDLDSTNGTFVNGEKVNDAVISDGDVIKAGIIVFKIIGVV